MSLRRQRMDSDVSDDNEQDDDDDDDDGGGCTTTTDDEKKISAANLSTDDDDDDDRFDDRPRQKKKIRKKLPNTNLAAVITLDLDKTLIDSNFEPFPQLDIFFKKLFKNKKFTVCLWTAGNLEHVDAFLKCIKKKYGISRQCFELILCRLTAENTKDSAKLDNYLHSRNLVPYVLIDDTVSYFNNSHYDINIDAKQFYRKDMKTNNCYINYDLLYNYLISKIKNYYKLKKSKNIKKNRTKNGGSKIINLDSGSE